MQKDHSHLATPGIEVTSFLSGLNDLGAQSNTSAKVHAQIERAA